MKPGFLYTRQDIPSYQCPRCSIGQIEPDMQSLSTRQTGESVSLGNQEYWEESFHRELLTVNTKCSNENCKEVGTMVMHGELHQQNDEAGEFVYFTPVYIHPAPAVFKIEKSYPNDVSRLCRSAFHLFWVDPAACGNKIRAAVERLLDDQGIEKTIKDRAGTPQLSKKGYPQPVSLNKRLKTFKTKGKVQSQCFDALDSIRWLGNSSSHVSLDTDKYSVFKSLVILRSVLEAIYLGRKIPDSMDYEVARVNVLYHPDKQRPWPKKI